MKLMSSRPSLCDEVSHLNLHRTASRKHQQQHQQTLHSISKITTEGKKKILPRQRSIEHLVVMGG
jgi:hypothetical protein